MIVSSKFEGKFKLHKIILNTSHELNFINQNRCKRCDPSPTEPSHYSHTKPYSHRTEPYSHTKAIPRMRMLPVSSLCPNHKIPVFLAKVRHEEVSPCQPPYRDVKWAPGKAYICVHEHAIYISQHICSRANRFRSIRERLTVLFPHNHRC